MVSTTPLSPPDDSSDYDNSYDTIPDVEGAATSDNFDSFADHGFQVEADSGSRNWASVTDDGFPVEFVDSPPRSWTSTTSPSSPGLDVVCSEAGFQISLSAGSLSDVKVLGMYLDYPLYSLNAYCEVYNSYRIYFPSLDSKDLMSVMDAPEFCGYDVNPLQSTFTVPFTGCNVKKHVGFCLGSLILTRTLKCSWLVF